MDFPRALDPFRALSASFRVLSAATGPILIGGILLTILGGLGPKIGINFDDELDIDRDVLPFVLGIGCCVGLAFFVLESFLAIGYARAVEEVERTGRTTWERVHGGGDLFPSMLGARLLSLVLQIAIVLPWILVGVGCAVLENALDAPDELVAVFGVLGFLVYLPVALYLFLGLSFVTQAVALDRESATGAIARSWELARGRRLALFFFAICNAVLTFVGFCVCCVGVLFTGTLAIVSWNDAYLALTRGEERRGWWIESGSASSSGGPTYVASAPPPPVAPPPPPPPPSS